MATWPKLKTQGAGAGYLVILPVQDARGLASEFYDKAAQ